jgi:hypothetical protein
MPRPQLAYAAAISLALLAACSKPAAQAPAAASNPADAAASSMASAADGAAAPGGAVSPPAANGAVNTDGDIHATDTAAASNSFTEGQARGHIENAGYTDVTGLTKTADGLWTGKAKKGGETMNVALDFKGAVTAK